MNVVTVMGSPHRQGTTHQVLTWVESALTEAGHEVRRFDLTDYVVRGCLACNRCQNDESGTAAGAPACAQDDDANLILGAVQSAAAFVLATPVYCWGMTSQLKALVDRTYCVTREGDDERAYLFSGRRGGLLVTAAGGLERNAELLVAPFEELMRYHHCVDAGHLLVPHCTGAEHLGESVREHAVSFARRLVGRREVAPTDIRE
jgi:multimeric flavodoxin WrbA